MGGGRAPTTDEWALVNKAERESRRRKNYNNVLREAYIGSERQYEYAVREYKKGNSSKK